MTNTNLHLRVFTKNIFEDVQYKVRTMPFKLIAKMSLNSSCAFLAFHSTTPEKFTVAIFRLLKMKIELVSGYYYKSVLEAAFEGFIQIYYNINITLLLAQKNYFINL